MTAENESFRNHALFRFAALAVVPLLVRAPLVVAQSFADGLDASGQAMSSRSERQMWPTEVQLTPEQPAAYDRFGTSVSLADDRAVIGAPGPAAGSGLVYVFDRVGATWSPLTPLDLVGQTATYFGSSVCVNRTDRSYIVVGAPGNVSTTGDAYVYKHWGGNSWDQIPLTADWRLIDDRFGTSVGIHYHIAVVGAPFADNPEPSLTDSGAAAVFYRNHPLDDNWGHWAKLVATGDMGQWDEFGNAVAAGGDAGLERIVVGAHKNDHGGYTNCGAAYVFDRNYAGLDDWGLRKKLVASDPADEDHFGSSVAMAYNGNYIVVGAPRKWRPSYPTAGAAYIFSRNEGGVNNWGEVAKIQSIFPSSQAQYGQSVAIEGGARVVAGAHYDLGLGDYNGAAYVVNGASAGWTHLAKLMASNGAYHDFFGYSVAVEYPYVLVGAPANADNGQEAGMAYIYNLIAQNDDCNDGRAAQPIGEVADLPFNTAVATNDGNGSCMNGDNIWYVYTPSFSDTASISLCGSTYDTKLTVYDGSSCSPLGEELCCGDDECDTQSRCEISVVEGNEYLIEIGGDAAESGSGVLTISRGGEDIPALGEWGLLVLVLLGLTAGTILFDRQRGASAPV